MRIGGALAIPAVLRGLGANPAEVLAEAGIDPSLFDDPDNLIGYAARGRLFRHCVERTGCQHFGLLVGAQVGLESLGLLGLLMKYSPDVGTALRSMVRYQHLHVRGAALTLTQHDGSATLVYDIYQKHSEATDQAGDGAVAALCKVMRSLCGPDWAPAEALFAHRMPRDVGPFHRMFRAPLQFDAGRNALVFAASWLNRSLPTDDPALCRLLQAQIEALDARQSDDFADRVRSLLRTGLLTGRATAQHVAAAFSLHSRTLHRRLSARGTTLRQLVDEGRFEIARQMLVDSRTEVREIASALDYADASAFTRAFRRWSGSTPGQWRAQHGQPV